MPVITPTQGLIDALRFGAMLVTARFTVFINGVQQGQPYTAQMSTGSITVDRNSEFRRSGQVTIEVVPTIPPPALMPTSFTSLLAPGHEIYLEYGITGTGNLAVTNWVPLGYFVIATADVDDTNINVTVQLDIYDRSWTIAQRKSKAPYNFPATASGTFAAEIQAVLNQVWSQNSSAPALQYNIVPTTQTVPQASYPQGSDLWQAALDMAAAVGYELYFGITGTVVGKPVPNPYQTPVTWNFTDQNSNLLGYGGTGGSSTLFGSPYSTPVEAQQQFTLDGIFNDIVIQGTGDANAATYNGNGIQTSGPPILAEASDTNSQSPTYVAGLMGDVPNFVSTSLTTAAGAQQMANNDLQVALSSAQTITLSSAPIPFLDLDDVCTATRPRIGFNNGAFVIDTITHSVSYDDVTAITGRVLPNYAA